MIGAVHPVKSKYARRMRLSSVLAKLRRLYNMLSNNIGQQNPPSKSQGERP
jgi:hypothetical protein